MLPPPKKTTLARLLSHSILEQGSEKLGFFKVQTTRFFGVFIGFRVLLASDFLSE